VVVTGTIAVGLESTPKRVFASALEWPGWSRAGRDEASALAVLAACVGRYASIVGAAGIALAAGVPADLDVVERAAGSASTAFGVPGVIFLADWRSTESQDGERLAALVRASWAVLDRVAATAPSELRKGPRGGGRERDAIIAHVIAAETAYARQMGIRPAGSDRGGAAGIAALRAAMEDVIASPCDGGLIPRGRWPVRYAARRIAWHALDHAWEIEDRAAPA
jgi:hypothetical protein